MIKKQQLDLVGWREWFALPSLKVANIKVKIDTGARTSALHVSDLKIFKKGKKEYVAFTVHPTQHSPVPRVKCKAELIEYRKVKSSTGTVTVRPVINVEMKLGKLKWISEVTLVNRDMMGFRMLIGREAIRGRFLVNPGRSFLQKKKGHDER